VAIQTGPTHLRSLTRILRRGSGSEKDHRFSFVIGHLEFRLIHNDAELDGINREEPAIAHFAVGRALGKRHLSPGYILVIRKEKRWTAGLAKVAFAVLYAQANCREHTSLGTNAQ